MPAGENLPQELIVAIVDNIQYDKKSLEAFSLVCKAWTNPAREHLFGSLKIDDLEGLEKIKAADIISTYTPFLRHLGLRFWSHQVKFWHEVIPFITDFRTPRLRSLALINLNWQCLSPEERSALLRRFESILSLQLSRYTQETPSDLITIICAFPDLQKLILWPSLYDYAVPGPISLSPELRLPERLSILRVSDFCQEHQMVLEWLSSIPEQLSIHTLHLSMRWLRPHDLDIINMFLRALGPSLKVFGCNPNKDLSVDLSYNTHLSSICFNISGSDFFSEDLSIATSTISRIGSLQLQQITFNLSNPAWKLRNEGIPNSEWIQVDAILASPRFATLKDIRICPRSPPPDVANLSATFASLLPSCHARGVISFIDPPSSTT